MTVPSVDTILARLEQLAHITETELPVVARRPLSYGGTWHVVTRIEISDGGVIGSVTTVSTSPDEAVRQTWKQLTYDLKPNQYLVTNSLDTEKRRAWKWNEKAQSWVPFKEGR